MWALRCAAAAPAERCASPCTARAPRRSSSRLSRSTRRHRRRRRRRRRRHRCRPPARPAPRPRRPTRRLPSPRGQGPPEQSTHSMAVYFTPFSSSLGSVFLRMRCVCRMCGVRIVWAIFLPRPSRDGYRTRQLGGSGLKSTTGGSRGAAPPAWIRAARTTRN